MEIRILMVMEPLHPAFEFYEGTIAFCSLEKAFFSFLERGTFNFQTYFLFLFKEYQTWLSFEMAHPDFSEFVST